MDFLSLFSYIAARILLFLSLSIVIIVIFILCLSWISQWFLLRPSGSKTIIAFFHPYCNGGGGGERVLWCAITALAKQSYVSSIKIIIYCGDKPNLETGIQDAKADAMKRFGLSIPENLEIELVYVEGRYLLEANTYVYILFI